MAEQYRAGCWLNLRSERKAPNSNTIVVEHDERPCIEVIGNSVEVGENQRSDLARTAALLPSLQPPTCSAS